MNSIFKLITNQQIPETANALVPVIGYSVQRIAVPTHPPHAV